MKSVDIHCDADVFSEIIMLLAQQFLSVLAKKQARSGV